MASARGPYSPGCDMTPHSRIRRSAYHQRTIRLCSAGGIWRQLFVLSQFVFLRVFGKQFLCIPLMVFDPADLWNHVSEAPQHSRVVYLRHGCRERLGYDKHKLIERPREGVVRGKFRCGSRSLLRCSRRGGVVRGSTCTVEQSQGMRE